LPAILAFTPSGHPRHLGQAHLAADLGGGLQRQVALLGEGLAHEQRRVQRLAGLVAQFEMQVRAGRAAAVADIGHGGPALDVGPALEARVAAEVGVEGVEAVLVGHLDEAAVGGRHAAAHDDAVGGHVDRGAGRSGDVDALVQAAVLFPRHLAQAERRIDHMAGQRGVEHEGRRRGGGGGAGSAAGSTTGAGAGLSRSAFIAPMAETALTAPHTTIAPPTAANAASE
jgi:hypothetical protein